MADANEDYVSCPSCNVRLKPRLDIKLKSVEDYGEFLNKMQGRTFADRDHYLTTARKCPSCQTSIQLRLRIIIEGAQVVEDLGVSQSINVGTSQERGRRGARDYYIRQLREDGVITAFEQAVSVACEGQLPRDIEGFCIDFLDGAKRLEAVPRFVMTEFRRQFPQHSITFWQYQGVVGVKAGKELRWFVPSYYVNGRDSKSKGANGLKLRTEPRPSQIQEWVRTRNGYVLGRGLMFDELKGRRPGDFSRAAGNY